MKGRKAPPARSRVEVEEWRLRWIHSDCKIIECIDGLISYEDGGYSTVARCPRCGRGPIPILPAYRGAVTFRTDQDLAFRQQERMEIASSWDYRRARCAEFFEDLQKTIAAIGASIRARLQDPPDHLIPDM